METSHLCRIQTSIPRSCDNIHIWNKELAPVADGTDTEEQRTASVM
jgi:hypothetical protein